LTQQISIINSSVILNPNLHWVCNLTKISEAEKENNVSGNDCGGKLFSQKLNQADFFSAK